jgi:hypothetical protein
MKKTLTLLPCLLAFPALHAQNSCAEALAVGVGDHVVPAITGTQPPDPICAPNGPATLANWYTYTPAEDQSITISTDLPGNNGTDTRLHVYGGGCGNLTCVGGDDDSGSGYTTLLTLAVVANTTYWLAWDNRWTANGFTFRITVGPPPPPPPPSAVTFTSQTLTSGSVWAIVDMNNDQRDDFVRVTATSVIIHEQQPGGGFVVNTVPTPPAQYQPSWSLCAGDLDGNGWNDLMYGAGNGVSFMLRNIDGLGFTQQSSTFYIFSQRTNMVDINNDGKLDAFVCHDVDANVYFPNDGQNNFAGVQGGLGETCGNYGSLWSDFDNDGLMDLFVAKCGCDPVDILMLNNGNFQFTSIAEANGFVDNHQSWSGAVGDFDNDGDMDVLIGSSSSSFHKLMRNNGDGTFTNVTANSGFHTFTGTSIEWTTHDFDNDGNLDVMGGGRILWGRGDMTFGAGTNQVNNGPVGDLNNDGFLDYMNGGTAYINNGNDNHWLKVHTVGTVSNTNGIGARIVVSGPFGIRIREVRSGDGFRFMSSLTTHFGLGEDTQIDAVTIYWPSGIVQTINNPAVDQTLVVVESTGTGAVGTEAQESFRLFPNPAEQWLFWGATGEYTGRPYQVFDAQGRLSLSGTLRQGPIDISMLAPGTYVFTADGIAGQHRFVKR